MKETVKILNAAVTRLGAKQLMRPGDSLSMRLPESGQFARCLLGADSVARFYPLCDPDAGGPDAGGIDGQIYAARADVGAVFVGSLVWTSELIGLDCALPWVFDEQIRQLGPIAPRVHVASIGQMPVSALRGGANAFCLNDTVLCLGMGVERLLLNIEILEKCAQSFVLATQSGHRVARIPWLVKFIATRRLQRDQKDAAARHLRGERSVMKAGY